jgi:hypothetical protein
MWAWQKGFLLRLPKCSITFSRKRYLSLETSASVKRADCLLFSFEYFESQ